MTITPIFVGGCDRSGTTMLGALLGGSPLAICTPESQFKVDALRSADAELTALASRIAGSFRFRLWDLDIDPKELAPQCRTYAELLLRLVESYATARERVNVGYWIDHTPSNLRYAALLARHFPNARFVHIVRDGRGVAASVLPLDWGPSTIEEAATWWASRMAPGLALELSDFGDRVTRVRYEDIVRDPAVALTNLCERLALPFHPDMTAGSGFSVPAYSASQHRHVGKPPIAGAASAWRTKLTGRQIEIFESRAAELLVYLGYEPFYGISARPPSRRERIEFRLNLLRDRFRNRFRARHRKRLIPQK